MEEDEDPMQEVKGLLFRIIKQTNKQKLPRRGKTDWLDWTRLGWTGQGWTGHKTSDDPTYGKRTHTELQTQGDYKGSNDEVMRENSWGK